MLCEIDAQEPENSGLLALMLLHDRAATLGSTAKAAW